MDRARADTSRATRQLSSRLFGGAHYRLEVAGAVAEGDGLVNLTALMRELGVRAEMKASVNNEIARLKHVARRHELRMHRLASHGQVILDDFVPVVLIDTPRSGSSKTFCRMAENLYGAVYERVTDLARRGDPSIPPAPDADNSAALVESARRRVTKPGANNSQVAFFEALVGGRWFLPIFSEALARASEHALEDERRHEL
jgi:hypothetical protein